MTSNQPTPMTFDLLTEPWLPVGLLDGTAATWGLLELFDRAHEARGLSEPSPLTYTAVTRFLLAILHRAYDGPTSPGDWATIWDAGSFDLERIDSYLEQYRDRFDLFHQERPFAQALVAGIPGDEKPITQLTFERVSGNNGTLYDHSVDADPPAVSPGDAARLVLTAHQYGFAGAQIFRDTPMIAGYCLMLEGGSLFETLALNLQRYDDTHPQNLGRPLDAPWWELENDVTPLADGNLPLGLTDLLTWRGRRILLVPDDDGMVRRCWYRPGYQLRAGIIVDPFKRCVPVVDQGVDRGIFPRGFQEDRALWRDSYAFFPESYTDRNSGSIVPRPTVISWVDDLRRYFRGIRRVAAIPSRPSLVATGIIKANQAGVKLWRMDRLPLPLHVLEDSERYGMVQSAISLTEEVRGSLRNAASVYAKHVVGRGVRDPAPEDVARELSSLRFEARYWSALDRQFQGFLIDLERADDPDAALDQWRRTLRRVATDAYFDATDQTSTDGLRMAGQALGSRTLRKQLAKSLGRADQAA